jgi:hypothetical protein
MVALVDPVEYFEVWHALRPGFYVLVRVRSFAAGYIETVPVVETCSLRRLRQSVPAGLMCVRRPDINVPAYMEAWF